MSAALGTKYASLSYSKSYCPEDDPMENEIQIAELRSDVKYIQTEVGDIKISVRDTSQGQVILRDKIDATSSTTNTLIHSVRSEVGGKVDGLSRDLHSETKQLAGKVDEFRHELTGKIEEFRRELSGKIDQVVTDVNVGRREISSEIKASCNEVVAKVVALGERVDKNREKADNDHKDVLEKIDAVKESISSAKIWALTLYIAQAASLLFVMARGFKWI